MIKSLLSLSPLFLNLLIITWISLPNKFFKFHPLTLFFLLFTMTFLLIMKMNISFYSWLMYFIFLIIMGGLMIMFMYICSVSHNSSFELSMMNLINSTMKIMMIMLMTFLISKMFYDNYNQEMENIKQFFYENSNYKIMFNMFFMNFKSMTYFFFYLLFSMLMIIHICYKFNNPMRQMKFYD